MRCVAQIVVRILAESEFLQREQNLQNEGGPLLAGLQAAGQGVQQQIVEVVQQQATAASKFQASKRQRQASKMQHGVFKMQR